jgi:primase-polymerase (primpol)-like protein
MTDEVPAATALPDPLVSTPQWVCWREESRDGKATKVPVEPGASEYASTIDPETWRSFDVAREHAVATGCGVGFVFTAIDRFVGVDLDDCRDPDSGALSEQATAIIEDLDSYTEVSPSGTGVHVLAVGTLPEGRSRHGCVEMYDNARFFTVTGDRVPDTPATIARRSEALTAVHEEYVQPEETGDEAETSEPSATTVSDASTLDASDGTVLDDETLLEKAKTAANGAKFQRLWRGSTAGYPSQSEADLALCCLLAFWTGGDAVRMDRLFRQSELMREKWDEVHYADGATYGERTIERAIAGTDERYDGEEDGSWPPIDEGDTATTAATGGEATDGPAADWRGQAASDEQAIADTLKKLRARLRQLEAENSELEAELEAERKRRCQFEADNDSQGFFSFLSLE